MVTSMKRGIVATNGRRGQSTLNDIIGEEKE